MPSRTKSDSARANGAQSHGPLTPEGRAQSAKNSVRHGLTAKAVVLPDESQEEFQKLLDAYVDQFQPATAIEYDLVQSMAVARWRLNRIAGIETNLFSIEIAQQSARADEALTNLEPDDYLAWVFKNLANQGKTLPLLLRYEGTLSRTHDRAFKQLEHLQRARKTGEPPQPDAQRNEPKPVSIGVHPRPSAANIETEPSSANAVSMNTYGTLRPAASHPPLRLLRRGGRAAADVRTFDLRTHPGLSLVG